MMDSLFGRRVVFAVALIGLMPLVDTGSVANANLVEWRLRDAAFNDGGMATGFLLLDTQSIPGNAITPPVDFDIKVSRPGDGPFEYTPEVATTFVGDDPNPFVLLTAPLPSQDPPFRILQIGFTRPLPATGGVVTLAILQPTIQTCSPPCNPVHEEGPGGLVREGVSGEVVGTIVPEPEVPLFLTVGFAALVGVQIMRGRRERPLLA
jgi:hypothetical protein